ncbi:histidine kinase [Methylobacterium sp. SI9]|uniref:histidine kinase n=1 Tax=Methylobacterium guangdongense TaxID=3138811 RepID=UPI00313CD392
MPTADIGTASSTGTASGTMPQGGCYRIQVLVVGRHKRWRDEVAAQVRLLGYQVTACDRGIDAMTVLALGLPVDVLVVDSGLQGGLCCAQLAVEARTLRPGLRIVLAGDALDDPEPEAPVQIPDALRVRHDQLQSGMVATLMREALADRAA